MTTINYPSDDQYNWQDISKVLQRERDEAQARIAKLEAALRPFAEIELPSQPHAGTWVVRTLYCNNQITASEVWKAREALAAID